MQDEDPATNGCSGRTSTSAGGIRRTSSRHARDAFLATVVVAGLVLLVGVALRGPTAASPPRHRTPIVVAAAASMSDVLEAARVEFDRLYPHVDVQFNFASSGTLQRQIEAGAPVDLFIAAAVTPMERLLAGGFIHPDAVETLAANRVMLIRPRSHGEGIRDWTDLVGADVKRIALGHPDHVPAGEYGRSVLQYLGLWHALESRLVLAENVRQVVGYVARGEVDAGIVYASDAAASDRIVVVAQAPEGSHPPVIYPMAVLEGISQPGARQPTEACLFAEYLLSAQGQKLLAEFGFEPSSDNRDGQRDVGEI